MQKALDGWNKLFPLDHSDTFGSKGGATQGYGGVGNRNKILLYFFLTQKLESEILEPTLDLTPKVEWLFLCFSCTEVHSLSNFLCPNSDVSHQKSHHFGRTKIHPFLRWHPMKDKDKVVWFKFKRWFILIANSNQIWIQTWTKLYPYPWSLKSERQTFEWHIKKIM